MVEGNPSKARVVSLRPHHICCLRFLSNEFVERGDEFVHLHHEVKALMLRPDSVIMAQEGPDMLCEKCNNLRHHRCASPYGGEDEVQKWDAILLREIGVPYGSCMTSGEWHTLLRRKIPFRLCARCQWNQKCSVEADWPEER